MNPPDFHTPDPKKKGCLTGSPSLKALFFYDSRLAIVDVHRDFKAKTHFGEFGFGPHSRISSGGFGWCRSLVQRLFWPTRHRGNSEKR
jgi:hypothetical protein